jgi:superkiller protein 3
MAAPKTFVRSYVYQGGETDSRLSARAVATSEMRNILLREVGEFLHGERKVSSEEYSEKIEAITAGVVEMTIISEDWSDWGNLRLSISAEMVVDPDDINRRIAEVLNDKQKTRDLEEARRRSLAAEAEIERLKKELNIVQSRNHAVALQTDYQQQTERLSAEDYFLRGYNATENGALEQAVKFYEQAIKLDTAFAAAYNNAGVVLQRMNLGAQAIGYFQRAIAADSSLAAAYNNIGNTYYKQRQFSRSVEFYKNAIALEPDNAMAYNNMGVTYKEMKLYEQAVECFDVAIEIDSTDAMAYCNMGNVFQNQGSYAKAIGWYERTITVDSLYPNAWYNMGNAYDKLKQHTQALACYQKTVAIDPTDAAAYYSAGLAYQNLQQYEAAIEWYAGAAKADSTFAAAYSSMGNAWFKLGKPEQQVECYQQAARLGDERAKQWLKSKGYDWE